MNAIQLSVIELVISNVEGQYLYGRSASDLDVLKIVVVIFEMKAKGLPTNGWSYGGSIFGRSRLQLFWTSEREKERERDREEFLCAAIREVHIGNCAHSSLVCFLFDSSNLYKTKKKMSPSGKANDKPSVISNFPTVGCLAS